MRLFKVYDDNCIDEYSQCLGIWADNEQKALRKMASIQSELENYWEPYDTVMNEFKVDEYFIDSQSDCYMAYPKDMCYESDVRVVFVPHSVKNVEEYIMDELARIESEEDHFRQFVQDKCINMSFAERFFRDDKGYLFDESLNENGELEVRADVKYKALKKGISTNTYLDELFIQNVKEFFGDNVNFRDEYLSYIFSNDRPFFDEEFYQFVARKLIDLKEWTEYKEIILVNIVAE